MNSISVYTADKVPIIIYYYEHECPKGIVLLIHGFAQNRYTWEVGDRSFPKFLQESGYDVAVVELRGHGATRDRGSPYANSLADHLLYDVPAAVRYCRSKVSGRPVFLCGHSIGGLFAMFHALKHAHSIKGVVALATPARLETSIALPIMLVTPMAVPLLRRFACYAMPLDKVGKLSSVMVRLFGERAIPAFLRPWSDGELPPELLQLRLTEGFDRTGFGVVSELLTWISTCQLHIESVTQDLIRDLQALSVPLLSIASDSDPLCPWETSTATLPISYPEHTSIRVSRLGHCDLVVGSEAPRLVWEPIVRWLQHTARST